MPGELPAGDNWPESNRLQDDGRQRSFHAYVHIPFCEVRCGYCDFNTYTQSEIGEVSRGSFHESLIQEVAFSARVISDSGFQQRPLSTVFIGGGTPSLFAVQQIAAVLAELQARFGFDSEIEITMEANPESLDPMIFDDLLAAGVNRISLGVQSFDPEVLQVLDRQHDSAKVAPLIAAAKQAGFRTSLDLIYGAPGESIESWRDTAAEAASLGTEHISAYSLIVEPGTKLERQIRSGALPSVDEDLNAEKYELASELIEAAGLECYEVSNFGVVAKHNLAYWQSQDWWGYGPGAHSHLAGTRFWNRKHPAAYQQAIKNGSPAQAIEVLTKRQQLEEELMLGLRTRWGVRRSLLRELAVEPEKVAIQLGLGTLKLEDDLVKLTRSGRLLADKLVLDFLS